MPIDKNKSKIIAISLSNEDSNKLESITEDLSQKLGLKLTKSQAIVIMMNNYGKMPQSQAEEQPKRTKKKVINYQAQILALKDKLGMSFRVLGDTIGINESTLKKYASGKQQPKAENEQRIIDAMKRYNIK